MNNKTIHISKESMERFNHDKNVVGITREELMGCQTGLRSDEVFDSLFDNGEYLERETVGNGTIHWVVGFIGGLAVTGYWCRGINSLVIKHCEILFGKGLEDFENLLIKRVSDDGQAFVKLERLEDTGYRKVWDLQFYYTPDYAQEYNFG